MSNSTITAEEHVPFHVYVILYFTIFVAVYALAMSTIFALMDKTLPAFVSDSGKFAIGYISSVLAQTTARKIQTRSENRKVEVEVSEDTKAPAEKPASERSKAKSGGAK